MTLIQAAFNVVRGGVNTVGIKRLSRYKETTRYCISFEVSWSWFWHIWWMKTIISSHSWLFLPEKPKALEFWQLTPFRLLGSICILEILRYLVVIQQFMRQCGVPLWTDEGITFDFLVSDHVSWNRNNSLLSCGLPKLVRVFVLPIVTPSLSSEHVWSSSLLCCPFDSLELTAEQYAQQGWKNLGFWEFFKGF